MKSGLADQDWISDLRKWLSYGEMMCQIKTIITSIIGALYMITVILGVSAVALKAGTITYPAGEALGQTARTLCSTEEDISEGYKEVVDFLDSICSVVNCAAVGGKGAGITSYIGGGVPWCADARDMFGSLELTGGLAESSGFTGTTVKDSLIMSVICLCLPGIIYNLDKLRQIHCFKAVCLHDDVKLSGYPPSMCDEMYGYMICAFVIGELFSLFPFVAFFDQLISIVLDLITNPVALFMTALGAVCTISGCASIDTAPVTYILCALLKTVSVIAEAVAAVKTFQKNKDAFGSVGNNWCDRMEDIKDEMETA
jgi:hypothetical protein